MNSPVKTFEVIGSHCDNLYLAHNKLLCYDPSKEGEFKSLLHQKLKAVKSFDFTELLKALNDRTANLASFYSMFINICYKPETRLMIGTGAESPYSSTLLMTFHQVYGVPYLPATAIKGCFRNYCEQESPKGIDVEKLLGSESNESYKSKGCLVFFDVFPTQFTLDFDVMTPHNTEYYAKKGGVFANDMGRKTPLHIPCVTRESIFNIYFACTDNEEWKEHSLNIKNSLISALTEYGIGAKTAYGYGLASSKIN